MGNDILHGGKEGFDKKTWQVVLENESPNPALELKYLSKMAKKGFPAILKQSFALN
jgi:aldose 1-epimerase